MCRIGKGPATEQSVSNPKTSSLVLMNPPTAFCSLLCDHFSGLKPHRSSSGASSIKSTTRTLGCRSYSNWLLAAKMDARMLSFALYWLSCPVLFYGAISTTSLVPCCTYRPRWSLFGAGRNEMEAPRCLCIALGVP